MPRKLKCGSVSCLELPLSFTLEQFTELLQGSIRHVDQSHHVACETFPPVISLQFHQDGKLNIRIKMLEIFPITWRTDTESWFSLSLSPLDYKLQP